MYAAFILKMISVKHAIDCYCLF